MTLQEQFKCITIFALYSLNRSSFGANPTAVLSLIWLALCWAQFILVIRKTNLKSNYGKYHFHLLDILSEVIIEFNVDVITFHLPWHPGGWHITILAERLGQYLFSKTHLLKTELVTHLKIYCKCNKHFVLICHC